MTSHRFESKIQAHRVRPVPVQVAADGSLISCPLSTTGDTNTQWVEFWTGWCSTCRRVTSDLPMPGTEGITNENTARTVVGTGHWTAWEHWLTRLHEGDIEADLTGPARVYGHRVNPVLAAWGVSTH